VQPIVQAKRQVLNRQLFCKLAITSDYFFHAGGSALMDKTSAGQFNNSDNNNSNGSEIPELKAIKKGEQEYITTSRN
jgi:hypothetical protein